MSDTKYLYVSLMIIIFISFVKLISCINPMLNVQIIKYDN